MRPHPPPRLQKIIHRNDGAEETCTERDGWCLPKTSDDLRNAMSLMIRQIIRARRPGERRAEGQVSLRARPVSGDVGARPVSQAARCCHGYHFIPASTSHLPAVCVCVSGGCLSSLGDGQWVRSCHSVGPARGEGGTRAAGARGVLAAGPLRRGVSTCWAEAEGAGSKLRPLPEGFSQAWGGGVPEPALPHGADGAELLSLV